MEHKEKTDDTSRKNDQTKQKKDLPEYSKPELMKLEEEIKWSRGGCPPSILA